MGNLLKDLASVFTGLSSEARLQMLYLLMTQGELCVCDFVEVLQITQSMASRHLRCLYHLKLVQDRRDAVWMHYRIADDLDANRKEILRSLLALLDKAELDGLLKRFKKWLKGKPCGGLVRPPRHQARTKKASKRTR